MAYVGGSPFMGTDPSGMQAQVCTTIWYHIETTWTEYGVNGRIVWVVAGPQMSFTYCFASSGSDDGVGDGSEPRKQKPNQNQIPCEVRKAMMASVDASNQDGIHEEGGVWGTSLSGSLLVIPALPGEQWQPGQTDVSIDVTNAANAALMNQIGSFSGSWHVHPKGNRRVSFNQFPSEPDKSNKNMANMPINIALGAGNKQVYFYNASGILNQMGFGSFMDGCE